MSTTTEAAQDARVRRAANKVGLAVRKSRRRFSIDNLGDYMLVDPRLNCVVAGSRFNLTAEDVIEVCREMEGN